LGGRFHRPILADFAVSNDKPFAKVPSSWLNLWPSRTQSLQIARIFGLARRKKSAFCNQGKDIMTQTTETNETKAKAGAIIVPVTPFEQNCTIIWCEATKKAVVVDPGGDVPKILAAIKQTGVAVEKIWLTHGHIDHVGGAAQLRETLKVPIEGPHASDKFLLDNVTLSGTQFGMTGVRNFVPDRWLNEGDRVEIGELAFDILHCPGHSPGSVVFFSREMRFAMVGDVLFNGSVGRTDLPGGNHAHLIKSITEKLIPLGDDVGFICGHGAGSSIGQERLTNPFLTGEM
jgi:glyoxylase-like metal-dependent hydrolase (beta-lactamase superfamily II)